MGTVQCFDTCFVCTASPSAAELSQSEQMSAGTIAPAQAHVSITANLIVCQCVSLKSTPICFYLNISGERHTSESEPVWYHVRFGNAVPIHVCESLKWIVRRSRALLHVVMYDLHVLSMPCIFMTMPVKWRGNCFSLLSFIPKKSYKKPFTCTKKKSSSWKKHLGLPPHSTNYSYNSQMTQSAMQNA